MEKLSLYDESLSRVYVFGQNSYGELGLNDTEDRLEPALLPLPPHMRVKQVAAGNEFTILLTSDNKLHAFGFNGSGQLGLNNNESVHTPTQVALSPEDTEISAAVAANGCEHSLLLTKDGRTLAMGYNNYGQLGINSQVNALSPVVVEELKEYAITSAACSYYHTVFIGSHKLSASDRKSQVLSCGRNENGQLGYGSEMLSLVPRSIPDLTGKEVVKAACGLHHTVFVTSDRKLYVCGNNENGQLGLRDTKSRYVPTLLEECKTHAFTDVACGYYHTLALTEHGEVFAFGRNDKGQLGIATSQAALGEPKQIKEFQIVDDSLSELSSSFKYVKTIKVACGCYHSVILSDKHEVFTFGRGNHGQLGHGNIFECRVPKQVTGLLRKRATKIAAGFYHTVVLVDNNSQKAPSSLAVSLEKILNNPSRADAVFLIDGKELYAHRCLLFARCKELDDLISKRGSKEVGQRMVVKMEEVSYESMYNFIGFLYTDKLELQPDKTAPRYLYIKQLIELMALGDRFKVDKIKSIAEHYIKKSLSVETAAATLKTANEMQDTFLKDYCIEFIMKNFGEVIGTQTFSELPSALLREVLSAASKLGAAVRDNQKT